MTERPSGPEVKRAGERSEVLARSETVWRGDDPVPAQYPHILPGYQLPFPHIGTEPQLFLDNWMVEWLYDCERAVEPPQKHLEPVLTYGGLPWESHGIRLPRAVFDPSDSLFKLWYTARYGASHSGAQTVLCYAESEDGIRWQKPLDRGGLPFEGEAHTNVVLRDADWHSVLLDADLAPHDRASADRAGTPAPRFTLVYWDNSPGAPKFGVARSPDGIHFERGDVTPYRLSHNVSTFWDPAVQKYVSYGQHGHHWHWPYRVRGIGRQESDDLLRWTPREAVMLPDGDDPPNVEYGQMSAHKRGDLYLGSLSRYPMEPHWHVIGKPGQRNTIRDLVRPELLLTYSRDGKRWAFAGNRHPWMENGPPGTFDYGRIDHIDRPVQRGDTLYVYYWATSHKQDVMNFLDVLEGRDGTPPRYASVPGPDLDAHYPQVALWRELSQAQRAEQHSVGLFTMREDRYLRVQPTLGRGSLLTRQFVFEGDRLYLNLRAAPLGFAQVAVLDDVMEPIRGFGRDECELVRGDSTRQEVCWRSGADVSSLWNRPIRLQIFLSDCWLYAFRFGHAEAA